jgi:hypothetical protein
MSDGVFIQFVCQVFDLMVIQIKVKVLEIKGKGHSATKEATPYKNYKKNHQSKGATARPHRHTYLAGSKWSSKGLGYLHTEVERQAGCAVCEG